MRRNKIIIHTTSRRVQRKEARCHLMLGTSTVVAIIRHSMIAKQKRHLARFVVVGNGLHDVLEYLCVGLCEFGIHLFRVRTKGMAHVIDSQCVDDCQFVECIVVVVVVTNAL